MSNKTCKEYVDSIETLEKEVTDIESDINRNKEKLNDYNEELKFLKKKYRFDEITSTINSLGNEKNSVNEKLISAKIFVVCDYINRFYNHKYFEFLADWQFWHVINTEFDIRENTSSIYFSNFFEAIKDEMDEFEGNLEDFIKNEDFPVISYPYYEVSYETYDDEFTLKIPKTIVDNLDAFKEKFEKLIVEYDKLLEEKIKEREQNDKEKRRKMWEELKKEFGE